MPYEPEDLKRANRCYLVGPFLSESRESARASLQELGRLCAAAGLEAVAGENVRLRTINPALYLGTGQTDRIIERARDHEAALIVFDVTLSPVHLRNWSRRAGMEVYDRHAVILEIFFRRAKTREAQLQVELARARYTQSHLVGMWQHLSRQGGGSRLARGEGEKQIEVDRRRLARRVDRAKRDLKRVSRQRLLRRRSREDLTRVALVGYTNAGKSSLLNALTGSTVAAADQLFASLDPTTRRLEWGDGPPILISDTVGFVRRLPPDLVDAFHSTLEEIIEAQTVLIVLDASDPERMQHLDTTIGILRDLGADEIPKILVLNKIDRLTPEERRTVAVIDTMDTGAPIIEVSARSGAGIGTLRSTLLQQRGDH
ncbi:MAG: GTPase HflX [Alkalispirochaeta sp.]